MFGGGKKLKDSALKTYGVTAQALMSGNPSEAEITQFITSADSSEQAKYAIQVASQSVKNSAAIHSAAEKSIVSPSSTTAINYGDKSSGEIQALIENPPNGMNRSSIKGLRVLLQRKLNAGE